MDLVNYLQQLKSVDLVERRSQLLEELAAALNNLLLQDFNAVVQLLYRVDVPEKKVKQILLDNPTEDAGSLLAALLLQRQEEKLALRKATKPASDANDDEAW